MWKILPMLIAVFITAVSCAKTFTRPYPSELKGGNATLEVIKFGGIEHSVLIRGVDVSKPLLLYLHGNGIPSSIFAHLEYNIYLSNANADVLEKDFLTVHYDRRGNGKTARISHVPLSVSNYLDDCVKDAEEFIPYLMKRFNKKKIYILAESYGSLIGAVLIQKHPEWFYGYIAAGQVSDVGAYYDDLRKYALQEAIKENNPDYIARVSNLPALNDNMTPKMIGDSISDAADWCDYYQDMKYNQNGFQFFTKSIQESPEYDFFDFMATMSAFPELSVPSLYSAYKAQINKTVTNTSVPVYLIYGENDILIKTGKVFYEQLNAPMKKWLVISNAGHIVRGDQPEEFYNILINTVLKETYK